MTSFQNRKNNGKISEYLILLIEAHNTLTLVYDIKEQLKADPTDSELNKWLGSAAKELHTLNTKLLNYTDEFMQITDVLENSKFVPQYLKIDSGLNSGMFSVIDIKLKALRQQNKILYDKINSHFSEQTLEQ